MKIMDVLNKIDANKKKEKDDRFKAENWLNDDLEKLVHRIKNTLINNWSCDVQHDENLTSKVNFKKHAINPMFKGVVSDERTFNFTFKNGFIFEISANGHKNEFDYREFGEEEFASYFNDFYAENT